MSKEVWISIWTVFILLIVLPLLLATRIKTIPASNQPPLKSTLEIYGNRTVSQDFSFGFNNLTQLRMTIKNPNLANDKDLILTLYDGNHQQISSSVVNGKNIPDGEYIKFGFSPIPDSANKHYTFVLSSPDSNQSNSYSVYTDGQTVSYTAFYKPQNLLITTTTIINQFLIRLTGDSVFFVFYLLLIVLIFSYVLLNRRLIYSLGDFPDF